MNLLDFRILTFALSVTNSISSSGFKPSFSPNKFLGLINDNVLLKISLNKVTLALSPDFLSLDLSLAFEKFLFPSKNTLFIFTFLFLLTLISNLILFATIVSTSCWIPTSTL